ncbi:hypothetical protein ColKHC_05516 [Colletotrichum higginsianum]|nr:hypothetical protein ColKHC_05516 [Colletotrichum higginsianum]
MCKRRDHLETSATSSTAAAATTATTTTAAATSARTGTAALSTAATTAAAVSVAALRRVRNDDEASGAAETHLADGALLNGGRLGGRKGVAGKDVAFGDELLLLPLEGLHPVLVVAQPGLVDLGLLRLVDALLGNLVDLVGGREVGRAGLEGDLLEGPLREETLDLGNNEDAAALGAGAGSTAEAVDVRLLVGGDADLEDGRDAGEVHAAGNDVGGDEDARLGVAVVVGRLGALALGDARVQDGGGGHAGDVGEDVAVKVGEGGRRGEDDGLEGVGADVGGLLADGADHGRGDGGEGGHLDEVLGHALVGVGLAGGDGGDELVALGEDDAGDLLDVGGDGGGEEHALAVGLGLVGEGADDVLEGGHEAHVEEAVGLVEHEGVELVEGLLDVGVGQVVDETSRGGDEDVAAVEDLLLLAVLVGASNGDADAVLRQTLQQGLGLLGDLHGQLAGRGDDEERDAGAAAAVVGDEGLDGRKEECDCLAGAGLGLDEAVAALGGRSSVRVAAWTGIMWLNLRSWVMAWIRAGLTPTISANLGVSSGTGSVKGGAVLF